MLRTLLIVAAALLLGTCAIQELSPANQAALVVQQTVEPASAQPASVKKERCA
jgi:hypothetical protein